MAQWDKITSSGDVEDRRGNSFSPAIGLGSIGTIVVLGIMLFSGNSSTGDVQRLLNEIQNTASKQTEKKGEFVDTKNYLPFAKKVLGSNNDVWKKELAKSNINYLNPKLVLFRQGTESGCGGAVSEAGPHYCQRDQTIYFDETFFEDLTKKFGAKGGDVAEAYVIAHEIGHHVQYVKGTFNRVDTSDNETSVRVELQADCYAGVWAGDASSEGVITEKEIDQAIDAAGSVGDDRIQKASTGKVNPESWTHGSSAQRKQWFLTGYKTKDSKACNTI
jgi:uncharacterized protein